MGDVVFLAEVRSLALARKNAAATKPVAGKKRQKPLTPEELRDAELLEEVWNRVEAARATDGGRPISKKDMALQWGVNPSNVSQYINGHIALNIEAKLRFCEYLRIAPQNIWPDFPFKWIAPGGLAPDALEVAVSYSETAEEMKPHARAMIAALPKRLARK
jgi:plasmid maintenance system antidote protein VapI